MRSDRLLAMLLLLQARSPISATELSERLEVSARTVYRDAEALSAAGIPVYAERGRSGGIALLPGFRTQVPGLTADEARSLFVTLSGASHTDLGLGEALGSALRKVMASLPAPQRGTAALIAQRVLVDPSPWNRQEPRPAHLDLVQEAVLDGRRLRIRYLSGAGEESERTLDPLGLVRKSGAWYLVAEHRRTPRTYRVDRIRRAELLETPVRRRAGFDLEATWRSLQEDFAATLAAVPVRVRVRRRILGRVLRMHGDGAEELPPDGAAEDLVELTLRFPRAEAAQALLAHGEALEVLDPPELRAHLGEQGRRIAALYAAP